jgi:hypothetical protein
VPVVVAQGQRVVHGHPLGEHLLVDRFGLLRVGEVVGEGGPNELLAGDTGEFDGGLVGVSDLAFGADRDKGVQTRLDHGPSGLERLPCASHVADNRGGADDRAALVVDR